MHNKRAAGQPQGLCQGPHTPPPTRRRDPCYGCERQTAQAVFIAAVGPSPKGPSKRLGGNTAAAGAAKQASDRLGSKDQTGRALHKRQLGNARQPPAAAMALEGKKGKRATPQGLHVPQGARPLSCSNETEPTCNTAAAGRTLQGEALHSGRGKASGGRWLCCLPPPARPRRGRRVGPCKTEPSDVRCPWALALMRTSLWPHVRSCPKMHDSCRS